MPNLDTLLLMNCLNCGKDKSYLRVADTTFMINGQPSPNAVVFCSEWGNHGESGRNGRAVRVVLPHAENRVYS
jgi:hypothetical protein